MIPYGRQDIFSVDNHAALEMFPTGFLPKGQEVFIEARYRIAQRYDDIKSSIKLPCAYPDSHSGYRFHPTLAEVEQGSVLRILIEGFA